MKKIGIIGGIGPESTIVYYRMMVQQFQEKMNTTHYPELFLQSIDMTKMLNFVFNDELEELVTFLKQKIDELEPLNLDYVALASNTPHLVFNALSKSVNIKLISIVEETCKTIASEGVLRVGLLGTKSTMTKGFYQNTGQSKGIEVIIPNEAQQNLIHDKYMNELVFNHINPETKNQLIQIVNDLQKHNHIEGIILGGTELPLILEQADFSNLKVFNTTKIHINAIVNCMISKKNDETKQR